MKTSKKLLSILLSLIMVLTVVPLAVIPASALDATGQCGEHVYWNFNSSTGALTISGTGPMWDSRSNYVQDYQGTYYETCNSPFFEEYSITSVVIEDGVTTIGNYAFYQTSNIQSVTVKGQLTRIGKHAFDRCLHLCNVTFETEQNGLLTIEEEVFNGCTNLESFDFPDCLQSIGHEAFCGTGLRNVTIPASVTDLPESYTYESGNTAVSRLFYHCNSLVSITVDPDNPNYSSINGVLYNKAKTELLRVPSKHPGNSLNISAELTKIRKAAFNSCNEITDIYYEGSPEDWENITGSDEVLSSQTIHYSCEGGDLENGITWHFDAATGTLTISGAGAITDIWSSMGYRFYENLHDPEFVTDIVIEEGITQIDVNTCEGLENVQTVSLPSTLEDIGDEAFKDCAALESVTVPEGVLWVGDNAFDGCSALRRVKLPSTLTYLGDHVFDGTDALVAVVMYPGIENTFEAGALDSYNNSNVRIYFVGTAEQLDATRVLCSDGIERPLANAAVVVQVSFPYCEVEVYLLDDTVGQAEYYDDLYQRVEFGEEFTLAPELAEHRYVKGWYQNHGELISSEATYTGTANTGFISMSCKIGCNHDWTGESYNTTRSCTQQYIYYETEPQRGDVIIIQNCAYCEAVRLRKQGFNNWTTTNKDNEDYLAAMARLTIHYDPDHDCGCNDCFEALPHYDYNDDYRCDNCGTIIYHTCIDNDHDCVCDLCSTQLEHTWSLVYDTTPTCTGPWVNWPENTNFASAESCTNCAAVRINYVSGDPRIVAADDVATDEEVIALDAHMGQPVHDWHFVYDTTFSCEHPYIDWPENENFASADFCDACHSARINYVSGDPRIVAADDVATDEEVLALDAHMKQHDWRQVYDTTPICNDGWINWPENTNFASADYCDACGSARINYVSGDPRIVAADDIATDEEIAALEAHMAIHYDADSNGFCDLCDAGIGDNAGFTLLPIADSEELAYGAYWFNMEGAKEYQLSLYEPGTSDYNETNYMFNVAVIGISDDGNTLRFVSHDARNNPIIMVVSRDEPDLGELWFSHLHQHGIGPVELEDPTTEVTVTAEAGVIPENTALVVVPDAQVANFVIGNGTVENYNHEAFDISLEDANGNEVQPQGGSVTVKLPIPVGYDKSSIKVYFVDDNGNKTDMNATVEGDYAVFTVDHFSKYVLVDETCLHNGGTEVRDAVTGNCHTDGYTGDIYCKVCGDKIADGENTGKDMMKHDGETELRGVREGNCRDEGYSGDLYCLGCGNVKEAGHSTGKVASNHVGGTEVRGAKAATCKVDGYTGDTWCKGCNQKLSSGSVISKDTVNHTPGPVVRENEQAATTEHGGSYDEVCRCSVCGKVLSSTHKTTDPLPKPADNSNRCHWCGKEHNGFFQKIVAFFHNIMAKIFGNKY